MSLFQKDAVSTACFFLFLSEFLRVETLLNYVPVCSTSPGLTLDRVDDSKGREACCPGPGPRWTGHVPTCSSEPGCLKESHTASTFI